jgi:hypothetical protein
MFNLSGKKKSSVVVRDLIWVTEEVKLQAIVHEYKKNTETIIVVWFDTTYRKLETLFSNNGLTTEKIFMARELASHYLKTNPLILAEHYPLRKKEEELFEKLALSNVTVYSSLDEPLFIYFGGDKISGMVKNLGLKEDEALEHTMISSSIKNAQDKIAAKVIVEQSANSSGDWLLYNLGKNHA